MTRWALVWLALLDAHMPLAAAPQPAACTAMPAASLERAACHRRGSQWQEAEKSYRAYLKDHPDSVAAAVGRIEVLLQLEEAALLGHSVDAAVGYAIEASRQTDNLVQAHPNEPAVLRVQAAVLGNLDKNPGAAEEVLKKITRLAPRNAAGWALLGSFYLDGERTAEGIACFERASVLAPNDPLPRAGLARGYAAAGRSAEAEEGFAAALAMAQADTDPLVFLWYGDFLASRGRDDESAAAYSRALAESGPPQAWLKRAAIEAKLGRYREAERDALEARRRGAREREVENVLVRVYRGLGDDGRAEAAAAAVARAAEQEEERRGKWRSARAWLDQAETLMQAGRFAEALPLYTKVTAAVPGYADAWLAAGICESQAGSLARAEQSFREFLRLQPRAAAGHSALGVLLLSERRFREARAELEEALKLDPDAAEAREALQAARQAEK